MPAIPLPLVALAAVGGAAALLVAAKRRQVDTVTAPPSRLVELFKASRTAAAAVESAPSLIAQFAPRVPAAFPIDQMWQAFEQSELVKLQCPPCWDQARRAIANRDALAMTRALWSALARGGFMLPAGYGPADRDRLVDLALLAVESAQRLYTLGQVAELAQGFAALPIGSREARQQRADWLLKLYPVRNDKAAALDVLGAWAVSLNVPSSAVRELESFWIRAASA